MSVKRVVVLHGYMASPSSHWFGWLREELAAEGVEVEIPELPDSAAPRAEAWTTTVAKVLGQPDGRTAVVAHSLGAVAALHALARLEADWELGALVAVSGFVSPTPVFPELDAFVSTVPRVTRLARSIRRRAVVRSDNDSLIPPPLTTELGRMLSAQEIVVPGAGHFTTDDGVTTLPEVAALLRG